MERYRDRIRVLAPHYLAILVLIVLTLVAVDALAGGVSRFVRWLIVGVVAIGYVVVLRSTGRAPEPWA